MMGEENICIAGRIWNEQVLIWDEMIFLDLLAEKMIFIARKAVVWGQGDGKSV